jgi:hypothetical protein
MKSLSKFKQEPTVVLEEEKPDYSKFDMLVRAGLANKSQIQRLHKILDKMQEDRPVFNNVDRQIMQNLFNKMVDLLANNKQIFQQTRRVVREDEELNEGVKATSDFKIVTDAEGNTRKVRAHRVILTKNAPEVSDVENFKEEIEQLDENLRFVPPPVLVLRRKEIRMFSNETRIALYYNDKIKKYFTVPYSVDRNLDSVIQAEETQIEESVMDHLHNIVSEKQAKSIKFANGQSQKVDHFTASAILNVHEALNDDNKKKISDMVHKSPEHFQKVANFAFSKSK